MVGTELAMELGGATIPEPCRGGRGGGGPRVETPHARRLHNHHHYICTLYTAWHAETRLGVTY